MDVRDKDLSYFWDYMPHEELGTASPDEFTNLDDLQTKIKPLLEYLYKNYAGLKPDKLIYHYYKRRDSFLGLEIVLDNPETYLLGTIRIYSRDNVFYYTFDTGIEVPENIAIINKVKSELKEKYKLNKFAHTTVQRPVLYTTSETIYSERFCEFYQKLVRLSQNMSLYIPPQF